MPCLAYKADALGIKALCRKDSRCEDLRRIMHPSTRSYHEKSVLYDPSLAMFACVAMPAQAADYPSKPINLLTVFSPGGSSDVSHRTIEKFAKDYISQPIVVTYKAGAGGEIGWTQLAQDKADGYSIGGVDLSFAKYRGIAAQKDFPAEAKAYLEEKMSALCANPEYQDSVRKVGLMPLYQSSAEFAECIKREAETARSVMIKLGKIKE